MNDKKFHFFIPVTTYSGSMSVIHRIETVENIKPILSDPKRKIERSAEIVIIDNDYPTGISVNVCDLLDNNLSSNDKMYLEIRPCDESTRYSVAIIQDEIKYM